MGLRNSETALYYLWLCMWFFPKVNTKTFLLDIAQCLVQVNATHIYKDVLNFSTIELFVFHFHLTWTSVCIYLFNSTWNHAINTASKLNLCRLYKKIYTIQIEFGLTDGWTCSCFYPQRWVIFDVSCLGWVGFIVLVLPVCRSGSVSGHWDEIYGFVEQLTNRFVR